MVEQGLMQLEASPSTAGIPELKLIPIADEVGEDLARDEYKPDAQLEIEDYYHSKGTNWAAEREAKMTQPQPQLDLNQVVDYWR